MTDEFHLRYEESDPSDVEEEEEEEESGVDDEVDDDAAEGIRPFPQTFALSCVPSNSSHLQLPRLLRNARRSQLLSPNR